MVTIVTRVNKEKPPPKRGSVGRLVGSDRATLQCGFAVRDPAIGCWVHRHDPQLIDRDVTQIAGAEAARQLAVWHHAPLVIDLASVVHHSLWDSMPLDALVEP